MTRDQLRARAAVLVAEWCDAGILDPAEVNTQELAEQVMADLTLCRLEVLDEAQRALKTRLRLDGSGLAAGDLDRTLNQLRSVR